MNRTIHPLPRTAIILAALAMTAQAELQIGADLSPRSTPVGEPVQFAVRVRGTGNYGNPVVKTDPSVTVRGGGEQSNFTMQFGGQVQSDKTYIFLLTPTKLGQFTVEAEIPIQGDALPTDKFTLTAREKTAAEKQVEPFLKLSTDARSVYVGQSVPIEVSLFIKEGARYRSANIPPELETNDFIPEPFSGPFYGDAKVPGYEPFDFTTSVTALKPGRLTLGPAKLQAIVDIPIGVRAQRREFRLESDPLQIEVRPLPAEGKPASFRGAVGSFQMSMNAEPTRLTEGDPLSINLEIGGEGNFTSVEMPELSDSAAWKLYPPRKFENTDRRTGRVTSLTFTQVIVPMGAKSEIPPFEFSFFDPFNEKYVTLRTDPVPIEVAASPVAPPASVSETGAPTAPSAPITPDASVPVADMTDILGVRPMADFGLVAPPVPLYRTTAFWAAQSIPLGALALIFLVFVRDRRRERAPKEKPSHVPQFADVFAQLKSSPSKQAAPFFKRAASALDAWEFHAGRTIASLDDAELDRRTRAIRERYGRLHFGGKTDTETPLEKAEREQTVETLTRLHDHITAS